MGRNVVIGASGRKAPNPGYDQLLHAATGRQVNATLLLPKKADAGDLQPPCGI